MTEDLRSLRRVLREVDPNNTYYNERIEKFVDALPTFMASVSEKYHRATELEQTAQLHELEAREKLDKLAALSTRRVVSQDPLSTTPKRGLENEEPSSSKRQTGGPAASQTSSPSPSQPPVGAIGARRIFVAEYHTLPQEVKDSLAPLRTSFNRGDGHILYAPIGVSVLGGAASILSKIVVWDDKFPAWRDGQHCGLCKERKVGKRCGGKGNAKCRGCTGVQGVAGRVCCWSLGDGYVFVFGSSGL